MLLLLGNGGHADVVEDALDQDIAARVVAPGEHPPTAAHIEEALALRYDPDQYEIINGIGFVGPINVRREAYERFTQAGFRFPPVIDQTSIVRATARIDAGVQVLAGAIVNTSSRIGANCIINSAAVIEHHVLVGAHSHVAPHATLCGEASIGEGSMIGAGAIVLPGVSLPAGTIVGAGAVVSTSYSEPFTLVGVPARPLSRDV